MRPFILGFVSLFSLCNLALGQTSPSDPLPRSTPEAEGIDSAGVRRLVEALNQNVDSLHSLMLLRHGKVVAEGWWAPYSPDDVHILYSMTKSFTSTAVGFAIQEGKLGLDDRVISFFPELAPADPSANLRAMRIRDLLRMNTGHQNDTIDRMRTHKDGAWVKAFLELEVENRPGTRFVYNSGASYMLSAIVQKVSGQTLEQYLQPRLFAPLGIQKHPWGLSSEGIALGDGGLSLRTEDAAKFGQLYLQRGLWHRQQLLSPEWVAEATSSQSSNGSDPDSNWEHGYGFQFWMNKTSGFRADGALGQFCFVLPKYDVVLAITSGTTELAGVMNTVWEYLLPSLHYVSLPPDPEEREALAKTLSHLTLPVAQGRAHSPIESRVSGHRYVFPSNEQDLRSIEIEFSAGNPVIIFSDSAGSHKITIGTNEWKRGRTGFQRNISQLFEQKEQGVAASGAWAAENNFTAKVSFDETPYVLTYDFKFDGDRLLLNTEYNVRWGPTKLPEIIGQLQP